MLRYKKLWCCCVRTCQSGFKSSNALLFKFFTPSPKYRTGQNEVGLLARSTAAHSMTVCISKAIQIASINADIPNQLKDLFLWDPGMNENPKSRISLIFLYHGILGENYICNIHVCKQLASNRLLIIHCVKNQFPNAHSQLGIIGIEFILPPPPNRNPQSKQ